MPKRALYTLAWSAEDKRYELRERGNSTSYPLQENGDWWSGWLATHSVFSFYGQQGHLNLLKEPRARGTDYWYAYRNLNRRTSKKYAGRTVDVTVVHLEELAGAFTRRSEQLISVRCRNISYRKCLILNRQRSRTFSCAPVSSAA